MTHHFWGDDDFDWASLNEAITYICETCRVWGRLPVYGKEKWGNGDFYAYWWGGTVTELVNPVVLGKIGMPYWLYELDLKYSHRVVKPLGIYRIFVKYQEWVYRRAFRQAIKRWPHIREELLGGMNDSELLEDL